MSIAWQIVGVRLDGIGGVEFFLLAFAELVEPSSEAVDVKPFLRQLKNFKGIAKELAQKIDRPTEADDLREMVKQLRYMAPALEEAGVSVKFPPRSHGRREIILEPTVGASGDHVSEP